MIVEEDEIARASRIERLSLVKRGVIRAYFLTLPLAILVSWILVRYGFGEQSNMALAILAPLLLPLFLVLFVWFQLNRDSSIRRRWDIKNGRIEREHRENLKLDANTMVLFAELNHLKGYYSLRVGDDDIFLNQKAFPQDEVIAVVEQSRSR